MSTFKERLNGTIKHCGVFKLQLLIEFIELIENELILKKKSQTNKQNILPWGNVVLCSVCVSIVLCTVVTSVQFLVDVLCCFCTA